MADKKDSKPKSSFDAVEIIFYLIFGLGALGLIFDWINKNQVVFLAYYNKFLFGLINFYAKYIIFSIFFSFVLLILIIIYSVRERRIRTKIMDKVLPKEGEIDVNLKDIVVENAKWNLVEGHINSDDANKWKLAIIEADIILSELLDSLHLPGEGVGEKLKNVEASDFDHIEEAWEAHKIRNAIAHEGSDFLLTQREAKRVVELYKSVFEEFEII